MRMTIINARGKLHEKWMELTKDGTDEEMMQALSIADTVLGNYDEALKADMVAMLEELDLTIDEIPIVTRHGVTGTVMTAQGMRKKIKENIQQKINALKGDPQ